MRKNKKGTTTLFLAIVLSALILVETTYMAYVADLDRRLTYSRALKEQTEIYLASYDRTLFKAYGIYAFNSNEIDSELFESILAANGYESGDVMYVSGLYSFDTDDLERAVAVFYSYRATGIAVNRLSDQINALIEGLDATGAYSSLRQFTSSPASGVIGRILDGGSQIVEAVSFAVNTLGFDESSSELSFFWDLMNGLGALNNDHPDVGEGFDPTDMGFVLNLIEFQSGLYDIGTSFNEGIGQHVCLMDYAANNFDCFLPDDTTLNGTEFSCFHGDNIPDAEYILTGVEGIGGCALTDLYIYGFCFVKNLVSNLTDPETMELIQSAGEILSAVVTALSLGSVPLPPEVYTAVIAAIWSELQSTGDLSTILAGDEITIIEVEEAQILTMGYRDFLTLYMVFVPDSQLLTRMVEIINRDFPDYVTGIETETSYYGSVISYEAVYELYG
ncbi:MAG: hypothetical protein J6127_05985 [Clostridiales bacterium]|nr:hypothetical protein [Clostridiales bacterium]